jgi:hypothetical protein
VIDATDLALLRSNFGAVAPQQTAAAAAAGAAVPEPASAVALISLLLTSSTLRRARVYGRRDRLDEGPHARNPGFHEAPINEGG